MDHAEARRVTRELSAVERERLTEQRAQIARELPEMIARDQMRKEAREESTLSGELRRAIHASELSIATIASRVGVTSRSLLGPGPRNAQSPERKTGNAVFQLRPRNKTCTSWPRLENVVPFGSNPVSG